MNTAIAPVWAVRVRMAMVLGAVAYGFTVDQPPSVTAPCARPVRVSGRPDLAAGPRAIVTHD